MNAIEPPFKDRRARWNTVAQRAVTALDVQAGDVVEVREHSGRYDILQEFILAIEQRGAVPRIEFLAPEFLTRLLSSTKQVHLENWDRHRAEWMEATDRVLALRGHEPALDVEPSALRAWRSATGRLVQIEESRRLPFLMIAVPTEPRAIQQGTTLESLEDSILPSLEASPDELGREISRVREALHGSTSLVIETEAGQLHLDIRGRTWLQDAGELSDQDRPSGTQPVLNFPAGSVYTTVNEPATSGSLHLPQAGETTDAVLEFENGRVVRIAANSGAESLSKMFDQHTGEPRRISHIGIGLNPHLRTTLGWPLVDEHKHGALFIAFGENRYLGGKNESSLNVDFVIPTATLLAGERTIVEQGTLRV